MPVQRIILANQSRLLREMLQHAIDKNPWLHTVGQVADLAGLSEMIERTDPQWVIVSLSPEGHMPEAVDRVLQQHSSVRILAMTIDGSQAKVRWVASHEKSLGSLSLRELVAVLAGDGATRNIPALERSLETIRPEAEK